MPLEIAIEGTAPVSVVDIVKDNKIILSRKIEDGAKSVRFEYEDTDVATGTSYYYVRVQQADEQMAWSSPMWITCP